MNQIHLVNRAARLSHKNCRVIYESGRFFHIFFFFLFRHRLYELRAPYFDTVHRVFHVENQNLAVTVEKVSIYRIYRVGRVRGIGIHVYMRIVTNLGTSYSIRGMGIPEYAPPPLSPQNNPNAYPRGGRDGGRARGTVS